MPIQSRKPDRDATDTTLLRCPDCNEVVMVSTSELAVGRRIRCLHCGEEGRLAPDWPEDQGGEGRYWIMVPMEEEFEERK